MTKKTPAPTAKQISQMRKIIAIIGANAAQNKESLHLVCNCGGSNDYPDICCLRPKRFAEIGTYVVALMLSEKRQTTPPNQQHHVAA